jgi:hypothetical protein
MSYLGYSNRQNTTIISKCVVFLIGNNRADTDFLHNFVSKRERILPQGGARLPPDVFNSESITTNTESTILKYHFELRSRKRGTMNSMGKYIVQEYAVL